MWDRALTKPVVASLCAMAGVAAACGHPASSTPTPGSPPADAQADTEDAKAFEPAQRVVVLADDDTTFHATMWGFERSETGWSEAFSNPVTIGHTGLGWGVGLHDPADMLPGDPVKHEGDGKSPMGMFALTDAWGYLPAGSVDTRMPYGVATTSLICVDETTSPYYNRVIDWQAEGLPAGSLPSHEDMLRPDDLYKYTIFVAHNSPAPAPGAGSCIFVHVWGGENSPTIGCTSMAEQDLVRLLQWLDPAKSPVLVQLTRDAYTRLRGAWDLPGVP